MKKTALLIVVSVMACVVLFAPHAAFAEDGYWENVLTFEDGENSVISWNYTPSSAAAAAGRVGTAEIVDDGTGNKALKVVSKINETEAKNNPASNVGDAGDILTFDLPNFSQATGIIEITGDIIRDADNNRPFWRFAKLDGAEGNTSWRSYSNYLARTGTVASFITYAKTGYTRFRYVIDLNKTTDNFYMYAPGKEEPGYVGNFTSSSKDTISLSFITYYQQAEQSWKAPSAGDEGVYWIDNIKVSGYRASVCESVPAQNATDVEANNDILLTLSDSVQYLDKSKIELYIDEEQTNDFEAVLSDDGMVITITPQGGLQYNKDYRIELKNGYAQKINPDFQEPGEYKLVFKTKSIIPPISNWKKSEIFTQGFVPELSSVTGVSRVVTLAKDGEEEQVYAEGTMINDVGDYIMVITATDIANGKTQTESYSFKIVPPTAPVAFNVTISGKAEIDEKLTGSYEYEDYNNDDQGTSLFRWLRADAENGTYTAIEGATGKEYTIQSADEGKWLKFEVTPVAVVEPAIGSPVQSAPFLSAAKPTAFDVKISKNGDVLTGKYNYSDANADAENADSTIFCWYFQDIETGAVTKIDGANDIKYNLKETDINQYIILGVTPVSMAKPYHGEEVRTQPYLLPCAPKAQNVSIMGTASVGNTLGAYYTFYDANGDKEGKSVCNWYVNNKCYSTGATLSIESDMEDATIYFEIIPVSDAFPESGEAIKSETVSVRKSSSSSAKRPSFSGGGGGSGSSSSSSLGSGNLGSVAATPSEEQNKETVLAFADTSNHWAKREIDLMREKGIVNGITDTEFAPDNAVSRGETAKLIAKVFKLTYSQSAGFTDVADNAWFAEYVNAVSEHGFMSGDGKQFRPNDAMTREEVCMILANIAQKYNISAEKEADVFTDANEISDWAKNAVELAVRTGFMNGIGDGKFAPRQQTTRAQLTVILYRIIEHLSIG